MSLLDEVRALPRMVSWFNLVLLVKLLLNVVIADIFGQYADRRLIQAALDDETQEEKRKRASIIDDLVADDEGAIWFDYVSDSGDGFDSTYSIAYLLAKPHLTIDGLEKPLPRGKALFMGGDESIPPLNARTISTNSRLPTDGLCPIFMVTSIRRFS